MKALRIIGAVLVLGVVLLFGAAQFGNGSGDSVAATPPAPQEINQISASMQQLAALALSGDYQAQRNLAYSYSRGWEGGQIDVVQGCAWRKVILSSKHASVDDSDVSNHQFECSKLTPDQHATAQQRAAELVQQIYNREAA